MSYLKGLGHFKKLFFKPRVLAFILTGIIFMFLTFFTRDNAIELGISGIASIFIGIGVNNFTAIETEQKDELKIRHKMQSAIKTLVDIQNKINKIESLHASHPEIMRTEMSEMKDYLDLCIHYLEDA